MIDYSEAAAVLLNVNKKSPVTAETKLQLMNFIHELVLHFFVILKPVT